LIALLVAIGPPKVENYSSPPSTKYSHKKCPECAEQILIEVAKCKHCGAKQAVLENAPEKVRSWCPNCRSEPEVLPIPPV
jgi:predicted RNA-binding Zn-ribbon protein involved in translation (DUF1610 family)